MLKLKLRYFGHLMWRTDSLEKTLTLGKIEGRRRRGRQRMRWLECITDSMDISLSKLQERVKDGKVWLAAVHDVAKSGTWLSNWTKPMHIQFSSVQSLSRVPLFATPCIAAHQASLSFTNSGSSLKLTSIESVMHSNHLILCRPLLLLPLILVGSPCSPRDSQEYSPISQFKSIGSSALSLLYTPTLTSIHFYWKNHSFDYTELCWQSNVSSF